MEFISFEKKGRALMALRQIENSILLLLEWNKDVQNVDDYLLSPEGTKNLAASCMLIEAIDEAYKKIDKESEGVLLPLYPDIPWKAVKGIRDRIAHGYFEIDADIIFETTKENLSPLLDATRFFIQKLSETT
ncbi:MAG: DUF86 domain-containing protein [Bacteroides intestinalis]|nr:DUF86 domain-containing protein [Bacteroides intestinalis]